MKKYSERMEKRTAKTCSMNETLTSKKQTHCTDLRATSKTRSIRFKIKKNKCVDENVKIWAW